ncbi:MAG: glycosyltransferase [Synechococcales cyanobacterium C42_A2020_086]|jgi:cellulose synthase/poly-beta-1,6-N-acetylglucosamine synthase-like glycosyltransferase|nr:glycosyltransferase [Synechococcales cyanobacterium C42_A2020_086]
MVDRVDGWVLLGNALLLSMTLLLLIPSSVLFIECLAALLPGRSPRSDDTLTPRIAVLVPAHNEALGIRPVLERLQEQLQPQDRLVVIADNCTDNTATIARSTGATVIERYDTERRGKGYALDYGMDYLAADPPDVVIVVDADCAVQPGTLQTIARRAFAARRPVQSIYLMELPAQPKPKDAVSALAFLVKNLVRPRGLNRLGLPGILAGTGMAFPWSVIRQVSLASGNIVEDMQLSMDLAIAGYPTVFCNDSKVIGLLPQQEQAAKSQRTRWEHGHLRTMQTQIPLLIAAALQQRRLDLLAIALDLAIPPLSLLVMLWLGTLGLTLLAGVLGLSWLPAVIAAISGGLIGMAVVVSWLRFGHSTLPAQTLLAVPFYLLWKIPLYFKFLVKPQTQWVRTERDRVEN